MNFRKKYCCLEIGIADLYIRIIKNIVPVQTIGSAHIIDGSFKNTIGYFQVLGSVGGKAVTRI